MKRYFLILCTAALIAGAFAARGDDQANSPEARMRDQLRNVMLQLRTVTAQRDDLQAKTDDLTSQVATLQGDKDDLTKRIASTQDADNKAITVLKGTVSDQQDSIARLQQELDQSKDDQHKAAMAATETEAKRAKLAELSIHLQRMVDDQKRRNGEMYKLGMEILDRYEKFGLGEALTAREPFTGITRTKFETLVQDYEDKLIDQRITGEKTPGQQPKQ